MDKKRRLLGDFLEKGVRALALAGGIALVLLALLTVFIVIMRYVARMPQAWAFDMSLIMQVYLIFFGGAYTMLEDGHVRVDLILVTLPERARLVINTITMTMVLIFSAILTWKGIELALANWGHYADTPARFPLFPSYVVIPFGAFFLCMVCITKIRGYLLVLMKGKRGD